MNLDKLKGHFDSIEKVEELVDLSKKVFGKCDDDVKSVVELFITKSYILGKKNQVKTFDE
jgi:hypothetical protein